MKPIERRLAQLEAANRPADYGLHICFAEDDEVSEAAVARKWPKDKPSGTIMVIHWVKPDARP